MNTGKLYNYEIVKKTMEMYKDKFLTKAEISKISGLDVKQVSIVLKAAWKLGWVSRVEVPIHNNCFGTGKFPVIRTRYKIKRTDSWSGIIPLYNQVLKKEREERTES